MVAIFIKLCQGQNLSFPPGPFNLTCIGKHRSSNESIQCNTVTSVSAGPDLTQNSKGLFREEGNRVELITFQTESPRVIQIIICFFQTSQN